MPDYKSYQTIISSDISGWYFGNILIGGLIGMLIIDPATGAMWTLNREYINVKLIPERDNERNKKKSSSVQVMYIDDVPEEYKDKLVKLNDKL